MKPTKYPAKEKNEAKKAKKEGRREWNFAFCASPNFASYR